MSTIQSVLSVVAGLLFLAGFVPYIIAIVRGETKPAKASWVIWASLDTITLLGMYAENAVNGQIVGAMLGAWVVVVLAIKFGNLDQPVRRVCRFNPNVRVSMARSQQRGSNCLDDLLVVLCGCRHRNPFVDTARCGTADYVLHDRNCDDVPVVPQASQDANHLKTRGWGTKKFKTAWFAQRSFSYLTSFPENYHLLQYTRFCGPASQITVTSLICFSAIPATLGAWCKPAQTGR